MSGCKCHNGDGDSCTVHVDGCTKWNSNRIGIFIKSHFLAGFHIDWNICSRASGEEGSDCALLQTFEDQWIRVFANTPEYQDRVCHKVDKQHGANQNCQQLSVFGEDGKTIGRHGIEHQTKDTERSKADHPCNYLGQRFGYIVQHILAGLACCTHTDTDQNSPEQNTDVVCIYKGVDGVGNNISKQCA